MSPQFTQHVDPVFMHVFDVLERIEGGSNPSHETEFRIINSRLSEAESQRKAAGFATGEDQGLWSPWKLSKYALVSWIDEVLLKAEGWPGRDWWQNNTLELEHFKISESNENFYVRAKEAASRPDGGVAMHDALETYYVCFMLGFRGLYRPEQRDLETFELSIRKYGLPADMGIWAGGMADLISQRRSGEIVAEDHAPERSIVTAKPLWEGPARLLLPWLLALLLSGLYVVCIYHHSTGF